MNERIKIGIIGAMNTGKTTLAHSFLQESHIAVVRESANDFFTQYPDADRTSFDTMHILQSMIRSRELEVLSSEKIVLTDRTIIDPIIYAAYFGRIDLALLLLDDTIKNYISTYSHFALCAPDGIPFEQKGLRSKEDPKMRSDLHRLFEDFLNSKRLPYTVLYGDEAERRMSLIKIIEKQILG